MGGGHGAITIAGSLEKRRREHGRGKGEEVEGDEEEFVESAKCEENVLLALVSVWERIERHTRFV